MSADQRKQADMKGRAEYLNQYRRMPSAWKIVVEQLKQGAKCVRSVSLRRQKIHYAWWILAACCLIQGAGLGVVNNCVGLFYVPICDELGFSMGDIALYVTFQNVSCCVGMLCSKKVLGRFKLRYVMTAASLLAALPFFLMSRATELWHWYVLGLIQGLGTAYITSLVVPIVLRQWFTERLGLAVGIAASFSGLTGAAMSAVLGTVIRKFSWRTGYALSGIVLLIMALPVSLLVIRMTPEEKGMRAYGYRETAESPLSQNTGSKTSGSMLAPMVEIVLLGILAKSFCAFIAHLPAYGTSISITVVDASLLTTFCMLGNLTSKLVFGPLNDRLGTRSASNIAVVVIGLAIFALMSRIQAAVCFGAFFFGTVSMFSITEVPLIAKSIWDKEHYADAMVATNVAAYLAYSCMVPLYGYLYDWFGRYDIMFLLMLGQLLAEWVLVHILIRKKEAAAR